MKITCLALALAATVAFAQTPVSGITATLTVNGVTYPSWWFDIDSFEVIASLPNPNPTPSVGTPSLAYFSGLQGVVRIGLCPDLAPASKLFNYLVTSAGTTGQSGGNPGTSALGPALGANLTLTVKFPPPPGINDGTTTNSTGDHPAERAHHGRPPGPGLQLLLRHPGLQCRLHQDHSGEPGPGHLRRRVQPSSHSSSGLQHRRYLRLWAINSATSRLSWSRTFPTATR